MLCTINSLYSSPSRPSVIWGSSHSDTSVSSRCARERFACAHRGQSSVWTFCCKSHTWKVAPRRESPSGSSTWIQTTSWSHNWAPGIHKTWWRQGTEKLSGLLTPLWPLDSPHKGAALWNLAFSWLNMLLNKYSNYKWIEMPWRPCGIIITYKSPTWSNWRQPVNDSFKRRCYSRKR